MGRGRRRGKKEMPALSDFHRNSVANLHRESVPHYENVGRQSLDNVYHNLEVVKPISPPLRTHSCNHPTNGAIKIYTHSLRSYNWLIYSTNSRNPPPPPPLHGTRGSSPCIQDPPPLEFRPQPSNPRYLPFPSYVCVPRACVLHLPPTSSLILS